MVECSGFWFDFYVGEVEIGFVVHAHCVMQFDDLLVVWVLVLYFVVIGVVEDCCQQAQEWDHGVDHELDEERGFFYFVDDVGFDFELDCEDEVDYR